MRLLRRYAALALLTLAAAAPAFADIALPNSHRTRRDDEVRRDLPYSRMSIRRVEGLREARLQIPRSQLERMGLAAGVAGGGAQAGPLRSAGTIVAGLFLSLAVLLTGLLLLRSRRGGLRVGRAAVTLAACASAAALAAVAAYANAGPPPGYYPQDPGTLVKAVAGSPLAGSIRVEVVEEGNEIQLLVPSKARKGEDE